MGTVYAVALILIAYCISKWPTKKAVIRPEHYGRDYSVSRVGSYSHIDGSLLDLNADRRGNKVNSKGF